MKVNIYLEWLSGRVELWPGVYDNRPPRVIVKLKPMPMPATSPGTPFLPMCDYFDMHVRLACGDLVYRQRSLSTQ